MSFGAKTVDLQKKIHNHAIATVHVGSVWNLQDCLKSSMPIKSISYIFYRGDLRSGQFDDLHISCLRGNMKMLPVPHKPIETTQFLQDHDQSPHQCRSECNWRSRVTGRSPEVKWGQMRSNEVTIRFSPISRDRMEIETRKLCQTTWLVESLRMMCISTYLGYDLTSTWLWPNLAWGQIFKLTFQSQKVHVSNQLDEATRCAILFFVSLISKKLLMKNHLREKRQLFI